MDGRGRRRRGEGFGRERRRRGRGIWKGEEERGGDLEGREEVEGRKFEGDGRVEGRRIEELGEWHSMSKTVMYFCLVKLVMSSTMTHISLARKMMSLDEFSHFTVSDSSLQMKDNDIIPMTSYICCMPIPCLLLCEALRLDLQLKTLWRLSEDDQSNQVPMCMRT